TFPSILSDDARPTTALAAVRSPAPSPSPAAPPPPTDKLSVVRFAGGTPSVPHDDSRKSLPGDDGSKSDDGALAPRSTAARADDRAARMAEAAPAPPVAPSLPAQNVL